MQMSTQVHKTLEELGYIEDQVKDGLQWTKEAGQIKVTVIIPAKEDTMRFYHSLPTTLEIESGKANKVQLSFDNFDTAKKIAHAVFSSFEAFVPSKR